MRKPTDSRQQTADDEQPPTEDLGDRRTSETRLLQDERPERNHRSEERVQRGSPDAEERPDVRPHEQVEHGKSAVGTRGDDYKRHQHDSHDDQGVQEPHRTGPSRAEQQPGAHREREQAHADERPRTTDRGVRQQQPAQGKYRTTDEQETERPAHLGRGLRRQGSFEPRFHTGLAPSRRAARSVLDGP